MRWSIAITERRKEAIGQVLVGLVLIGAIVLTACDAPTGRRSSRETAQETAAVVSARVEGPQTTTVTPSAPAPIVQHAVTYEEAETAFQARDYAAATQLFGSYVERKPDNPWGHYMLGLSAWKGGDHERAVEAFERALALDPTHVKSYLNLARVLLEVDRPAEALARIDSAIGFDSLSNVAYRLRGLALDGLDRVDEAIDSYQHALTLDEKDVWSMNNLGVLYLDVGWPDEALYPLARAVSLDSTQAVFFNNLGMALEQTGRWARAAEVYRQAVAVDSTHAKAVANLARIDGRADDPFVDAVDLALLAQEFAGWIEGWRRTDVTALREQARTP